MRIDRTRLIATPAGSSQKRDVRTQFAALCYRRKGGETQVLLITSRETGRWVMPKGWPMDGLTPVQAAEREAWEEAGVRGRVGTRCLGIYSYSKVLTPSEALPCVVALFPLKVLKLENDFPERRERRRKWFALDTAADKVEEPELAGLLRSFDPAALST
jgi:8-oxo-dGTP pyrophosphatase MutT (NUDIX family)